jgi:CRISPR-associated protein Cas5d
MKPHVDLMVWGEYACFTRPEFKAERETYPCITPSAARGLLEAIYWKPQIRYRILEIHICRPIRRFSLLRNEIKDRQTKGGEPIFADDSKQRVQRNSLILRDVAYRIKAWIDIRTDEPGETIGKHLACYQRRIERGASHHQPCLGCREFPASFAQFGTDGIPVKQEPEPIDDHFGTMQFDTAFLPVGDEMTFYRHKHRSKGIVSGSAKRLFFPAEVTNGVLSVPQGKYDEIAKLEGKKWGSIAH